MSSEKRKSRDYYSEEYGILDKYPAIKEVLAGDTGLMSSAVRVPDEMFQSLHSKKWFKKKGV
jgi:hypothetical protein